MKLSKSENIGELVPKGLGSSRLNSLALASFLFISALSGGCKQKVEAAVSTRSEVAAYNNLDQQPGGVLVSRELGGEKKEGYDFKDYVPPAEFGQRIPLDKEFVAGRKTVVYIVDQHPDPDMASEASMNEGKAVQRQLFFILKDLLEKAGTLPMVVENWAYELEGMSFGQLGEMMAGGLNAEEQGALVEMYRTDSEKKRMAIASEHVGKDAVVGGMYMIAASPKVKALGSVSAASISGVLDSVRQMESVQYAVNNPGAVICSPDSNLTFKKATQRFERGNRSRPVVDCYCGVRLEIARVVEDFAKDRFVDAPRREIERALDFDGNFVVVVAGLNHLMEAVRRLKDENVNVLLLSPKGMIGEFPRALNVEPEIPDVIPKDDRAGTCAKNEERLLAEAEKAARAEMEAKMKSQEEALRDWLMDDE